MSGTQSMLKSRCDGYAGLVAALDPATTRSNRSVAEPYLYNMRPGGHRGAGSPAERPNCAPYAVEDNRKFLCRRNSGFALTDAFNQLHAHALSELERRERVSKTPAASYR